MDASPVQDSPKKGEKNFKWSKTMSQFLVEKFVEHVKLGHKDGKGFKRHVYSRIAYEVTEKFGSNCAEHNVENHFRTLKRSWKEVSKLRRLNEHEFDPVQKIIHLDEATMIGYIKENPKAEPFINQPIWMYDELALICQESGHNLPKTSGGGILQVFREDIDSGLQSPKGNNDQLNGGIKGKGKRMRESDGLGFDELKMLAIEMRDMLKDMKRDKKEDYYDKLHRKLMSCEVALGLEGYSEDHLMSAYLFLIENHPHATMFMRCSDDYRLKWLRRFFHDKFGVL